MDDAAALFDAEQADRLPPLLGLACLVVLAGLALRQPLLAFLGAVVAVTLVLALLWRRVGLRAVHYTRQLSSTRAFPGELITMELILENNKLLPLPWLEVEDDIPDGLAIREAQLEPSFKPKTHVLRTLFGIRPYERIRRRYTLIPQRRGVFRFGPARLRTGDPFGLAFTRQEIDERTELLVYPPLLPLEAFQVPSEHPLGERSPLRPFLEDPTRYAGVRPYAPGDAPRRIHWAATARTGEVQVKHFESGAIPLLALFLDINTFQHYWEGLDPEKLEHAIALCAALARWGLDAGYQVGLYVNAPQAGGERLIRLLASRHPRQLQRILEALARLVPYTGYRIERLLASEARMLPWGATLAVITALVTPELERTLIRLYREGHTIALFAVGDAPSLPSRPGFVIHTLEDLPNATMAASSA
ncbi:MAG: DUF58 domain-containing protein [Thermorudis peleae]|nr:DUF58 domain-containing protein [Thermorudis peleae]